MIFVKHIKGDRIERSSFESKDELAEHLDNNSEYFEGFEHFTTDATDDLVDQKARLESESYLIESDYKVLRHIREKYLNIPTTLSEINFTLLEQSRQVEAVKIDTIKKNPKPAVEEKYVKAEPVIVAPIDQPVVDKDK